VSGLQRASASAEGLLDAAWTPSAVWLSDATVTGVFEDDPPESDRAEAGEFVDAEVAGPLEDAGRPVCCEAFSSFDSFAAFAASVHCPSFSGSLVEGSFRSESFELEPFPESFCASFLDDFSDSFSAGPFLSEPFESFELESLPESFCASFLDDFSDSFSAGPCLSESLSESFFDDLEGSFSVEVVEAELEAVTAVAVEVVSCVVEDAEVVACTVVDELEVVALTVVELEEVAVDVGAVAEFVEDDEDRPCAAAVSASA
jgi:hypothetical protein